MLRKKFWLLAAVLTLVAALAIGCGSPVDDEMEGLAPGSEQVDGTDGDDAVETDADADEEGEDDSGN